MYLNKYVKGRTYLISNIYYLHLPASNCKQQQSTDLLTSLPEFIKTARSTVEGWNQEYSSNIPDEIRLEIDRLLENTGAILVGAFRGLLSRTAVAAVHALTLGVGLIVVPIFVFYLLKDRDKIRESFIESFPVSRKI